MDKPIAEIKDRLKLALSLREITPKELSEKTKIPKSSISQYMSGYAKPKQDRIFLISNALNINEVWLLGYDVSMEKQITKQKEVELTPKDERDIKKDLDSLMEKLTSKEYGPAAYDGEEIPEEDQELFAGQLELMLRRLKKINKVKYNPYKNKDKK